MTSDTTMILNLTFVGTLMIAAFLAALVLFAGCMALVFTGLGRLVYLGASRLIGVGRNLGGRVAAARQTTDVGTALDDADATAAPALTADAANVSPDRAPAASSSAVKAPSVTPADAGRSGLIPSWSKASTPSGTTPSGKAAPSVKVTLTEPAATPAAVELPAVELASAPAGKTSTVTPANAARTPKKPGANGAARNAAWPKGSARNAVPGLLRPSQDSEEQHAKGA